MGHMAGLGWAYTPTVSAMNGCIDGQCMLKLMSHARARAKKGSVIFLAGFSPSLTHVRKESSILHTGMYNVL